MENYKKKVPVTLITGTVFYLIFTASDIIDSIKGSIVSCDSSIDRMQPLQIDFIIKPVNSSFSISNLSNTKLSKSSIFGFVPSIRFFEIKKLPPSLLQSLYSFFQNFFLYIKPAIHNFKITMLRAAQLAIYDRPFFAQPLVY